MPKAKKNAAPRRREVESEAYVPEVAAKPKRQKPPPQLEESAPFLFTHHPEAYTVMGGRVIPRLGKLKLAPGINGVEEEPKTGRIIAGPAIDQARNNGLIVIPHDVDGEGTTYLRRPKGAPHATLTRFERVYPGSSRIDCDEVAYVEWTRSLVERGVLPPAPAYILQRMHAELLRQIEDLEDRRGVESLRKRLRRDLDAVEEELELRGEEAAELEEVEVDDDDVDPAGGES